MEQAVKKKRNLMEELANPQEPQMVDDDIGGYVNLAGRDVPKKDVLLQSKKIIDAKAEEMGEGVPRDQDYAEVHRNLGEVAKLYQGSLKPKEARATRDKFAKMVQNPEGMTMGQAVAIGLLQAITTGVGAATGGVGGAAVGAQAGSQAGRDVINLFQSEADRKQKGNMASLQMAQGDYERAIDQEDAGHKAYLKQLAQLGKEDRTEKAKIRGEVRQLGHKLTKSQFDHDLKKKLALYKKKHGALEKYPGETGLDRIIKEDKIWNNIVRSVNTEKVRSAQGVVKNRLIQSKFVRGVFEAIPPKGVPYDEWIGKLRDNPGVLEKESRIDRKRRFNEALPFQRAEAVLGFVRQVTGGEPSDEQIQEVLRSTLGGHYAKFKNYFSSWKEGEDFDKRGRGTGDAEFMEALFQSIIREEDIAESELDKMIGASTRRYKTFLSDPKNNVIFQDMLTNPESFVEEFRGGAKDTKVTPKRIGDTVNTPDGKGIFKGMGEDGKAIIELME